MRFLSSDSSLRDFTDLLRSIGDDIGPLEDISLTIESCPNLHSVSISIHANDEDRYIVTNQDVRCQDSQFVATLLMSLHPLVVTDVTITLRLTSAKVWRRLNAVYNMEWEAIGFCLCEDALRSIDIILAPPGASRLQCSWPDTLIYHVAQHWPQLVCISEAEGADYVFQSCPQLTVFVVGAARNCLALRGVTLPVPHVALPE